MTEEHAKAKWCPMVHTRYIGTLCKPDEAERAIEISDKRERLSKCIASDCMMWRWTGSEHLKAEGECGLGGRYD